MRPFGFMRNESVPGGLPQTAYPIADGSGSWSVGAGSGTNLWDKIDDVTSDDATTFIESGRTALVDVDQDITLAAMVEPSDHSLTKINLRYRRDGATTSTVRLRVLLNGTVVGTATLDNDNDWDDWTITLTSAQSQSTMNWGSANTITLRKLATTYTRGVDVTYLNITTEQ